MPVWSDQRTVNPKMGSEWQAEPRWPQGGPAERQDAGAAFLLQGAGAQAGQSEATVRLEIQEFDYWKECSSHRGYARWPPANFREPPMAAAEEDEPGMPAAGRAGPHQAVPAVDCQAGPVVWFPDGWTGHRPVGPAKPVPAVRAVALLAGDLAATARGLAVHPSVPEPARSGRGEPVDPWLLVSAVFRDQASQVFGEDLIRTGYCPAQVCLWGYFVW